MIDDNAGKCGKIRSISFSGAAGCSGPHRIRRIHNAWRTAPTSGKCACRCIRDLVPGHAGRADWMKYAISTLGSRFLRTEPLCPCRPARTRGFVFGKQSRYRCIRCTMWSRASMDSSVNAASVGHGGTRTAELGNAVICGMRHCLMLLKKTDFSSIVKLNARLSD